MSKYTQSILQKLDSRLQIIEREEKFQDKPWVYIDSAGESITYIFRKDGRLHITKNSEVADGKWEFLMPVHSLLLSTQTHQRLYNPCYLFNDAILVMYPHDSRAAFLLINRLKIPDLNVLLYLDNLEIQQLNDIPKYFSPSNSGDEKITEEFVLKNGKKVLLKTDRIRSHFGAYTTGKVQYKDTGKVLPDGKYALRDGIKWIRVRKGVVVKTWDEPESATPLLAWTIIAAIAIVWVLLTVLGYTF